MIRIACCPNTGIGGYLARFTSSRPTDSELAILRILWDRGPSTVREVCAQLNRDRRTGYTTALKLMQIMFEKGTVTRDEREQSHVYAAKQSERQTQRLLLRDLADRAFGGSARRLILGALSAKKVSAEELSEIRTLLDQMEGGSR
ncbi:MAG TPA: BlaI/MecI/CopY family transcriptional regulator [Tepidisphaeraceae bacterium]